MCTDLLAYLFPFLPLIPRGILAIWFRQHMRDVLGGPAIDRANHRTLLAALAGFSFAGLLALVALPGMLTERQLPIWYMLVSFLAYLAVLNLQGYKAVRWHDHIGDALYEIASLGLVAAILAFILKSHLALPFRIAATSIAAIVWTVDFVLRLSFTVSYLRAKEKNDGVKK